MNLGDARHNRWTVPGFLAGLIFSCFYVSLTTMSAGAETKPSFVASTGPPLYLSRSEVAKVRKLAGPKGNLQLRVLMVIDHGQFAKLEAIQSSGDLVLDRAVVNWLRRNWEFAPTQSGSFNLPVIWQLLNNDESQQQKDTKGSDALSSPTSKFHNKTSKTCRARLVHLTSGNKGGRRNYSCQRLQSPPFWTPLEKF